MLLRNVVDKKKDKFMRFGMMSRVISRMIDKELERIGLLKPEGVTRKLCTSSEDYDYGDELDIRLDSFDKNSSHEFYLTSENYEELFVMAFDATNNVVLHVHIDKIYFEPNEQTKEPMEDRYKVIAKEETGSSQIKHELRCDEDSSVDRIPTFRGIPIDINGFKQDNHFIRRGELLRESASSNDRALNGFMDRDRGRNHSNPRCATTPKQTSSPISIHDADDYLVQDPSFIIPFSQESANARIADLQTIAMTNIPDVSSIPKLLKSHNVAFKKDENAMTWYQRFHNFCAMIGVYLTPPKAMEKNSIMGKEWDNKALPLVFYSRFEKMKKILSHILFSPDFFPKEMQDDLQLNPHPYNFLRLFMALHSHSVPDLSDRVIKRPGAMKQNQSLSQYALLWVNYFVDEENVNGVRYSKFRQYCYFLDGLPQKYSILRKFLEMEFMSNHNKVNNIPISLELRNLPSTITSLANIHGIPIVNSSASNIHQISDHPVDCDEESDKASIKAVMSNKSTSATNHQRDKLHSKQQKSQQQSTLRCWLCDGPHSFRQCTELTRMKSLCIKHPSVLKHFQQLLLDKNGEAIRVMMEAPEFFDDASFPASQENNENESTPLQQSDDDHKHQASPEEHINSLQIGTNEFDVDDDILDFDVISCIHDEESISAPTNFSKASVLSIADPTFFPSIKYVAGDNFPRVQVDGGADRSITPHRELVHDFRLPDPSKGDKTYINDAGEHAHKIVGYGFFRVRCLDSASRPVIIKVPCAYIPSIPSTLLNFRTMPRLMNVTETSNMLLNVGAADLTILDSDDNLYHLFVPLIIYKTRLYADNALLQCEEIIHEHERHLLWNDRDDTKICSLSEEPNRILWHARLGHLNFRRLSEMHKFALGIPKFKQSHQHEQCSTCLMSKLRRSPHGHGTISDRRAEVHGQVLCADWGFVCQNSSDPTRMQRLTSVYGDTSYLIFTCAYTGAVYGVCAGSKSVPTKWLHIFLHRISSGVGDRPKTILVDRGSELGRSLEFKRIAEIHRYLVPTAGPDKSSMNGMGERPHSTIGDAIRSIL
jgi:hypothetical protein